MHDPRESPVPDVVWIFWLEGKERRTDRPDQKERREEAPGTWAGGSEEIGSRSRRVRNKQTGFEDLKKEIWVVDIVLPWEFYDVGTQQF